MGMFNKKDVIAEAKKQLWLALPLIGVTVLQFSMTTVSAIFVGHLGALPLAGASMALCFASVSGFSVLAGMGSALDTLCGQAYGANQYHLVGIHMQRAMLILLLLCIPLAFIWANTNHILVLLRQDANVSAEAGVFARGLIPSVFAYALFQCLCRFLQSQKIICPMMISTGITASLHILLCWIFVIKLRLGGKGSAVATSISSWFNLLILALYVKFSSACEKTWTGFSKAALHDTMRFVRLAVPSACMVCMRSWALQLMVFMSGLLPEAKFKTSVMSIGLNTSTMLFTIPFALGNAVSIRVSNELGSGHPKAAYLSVFVGAIITVSVCTILESAILSVRNIFGYVYSNDEKVVKFLASLIKFIALTNLLDGIQSVLSGTLRGCGSQKIGAYINLGAFYLVGLPLGALLAFVFDTGVKGLWMGIISGLAIQSLLLPLLILRINWEEEVKKAQERVQNSSMSTPTADEGSPLRSI